MYDDEARIIEKLGERYPAWREMFDDPATAARAFGIRADTGHNPEEWHDGDPGDEWAGE